MSVIRNIDFKRGSFSLSIKEWDFPDSGVTVLKGRSGCGKTTLVNILCGLLPCRGFSWIFQGEDLAKLPAPERGLSVLFQDLRLFPSMSAQDNILFPPKATGQKKQSYIGQFDRVVRRLSLQPRLSAFVEDLSGGERQRVALARALMATRARFMILDEPFAHLDQKTLAEAAALTWEIITEKKLPALLISHKNGKFLDKMAAKIYHL